MLAHLCPAVTTPRATTDGDRPAQSAVPDDKASWTAGTRDPSGGRSVYLIDHGAEVEEIGRLRWALNQVVMLADDAPGLTDERLRDRGCWRWPTRYAPGGNRQYLGESVNSQATGRTRPFSLAERAGKLALR
jgi:hypothetical protein